MSNQVYANNMEVSCKSAAGKSICAFPDVCFTPPLTPATPPGVPIPYPNTGMASDCTDGSSTVKVSGQEVMLKNKSYFKRSTGDEAGCAPKKGIINSKVSGKVYFTAWSMNIMIEGENVVRNLDLTTGNHGSTPPNEGIPWAYLDEMAVSSPEDQACKDQAEEFKKACEPAVKVKKDNSLNVAGTGKAMCEDNKCAEKRECILLPFNLGCCPSSTGEDRTAHHLVPNSLIQGVRGKSSTNIPGIKSTYTDAIAPCCCVTGASHHQQEHGEMHEITMDKLLVRLEKGRPIDYPFIRKKVAEAHTEVLKDDTGKPRCNQKCLELQLDAFFLSTHSKPNEEMQLLRKNGKTKKIYALA